MTSISPSDVHGNLTEVVGISSDAVYQNGTGRRVSRILGTVSREMYLATYICNVSVSVFYQKTITYELDVQRKSVVTYTRAQRCGVLVLLLK